MIDEIQRAFIASIQMLEDGIHKIPDSRWRHGDQEYLVPVRIAYHIIMGLEWLVSTLPPEEHLRMRRFQLGDTAIDEMPDRQALLAEITWVTGRVEEWFFAWSCEVADGMDTTFRLKKALYFLRHTQHHIGEFSATARLMQLERPDWEFLQVTDLTLIRNMDGPAAYAYR